MSIEQAAEIQPIACIADMSPGATPGPAVDTSAAGCSHVKQWTSGEDNLTSRLSSITSSPGTCARWAITITRMRIKFLMRMLLESRMLLYLILLGCRKKHN